LPRPEPCRSTLRPVELECAEVKAGRIIGEELRGLGWKEGDPSQQPKNDLDKLALAACMRRETILNCQLKKLAKLLDTDEGLRAKSFRIERRLDGEQKRQARQSII
jgi:hypothetical protein